MSRITLEALREALAELDVEPGQTIMVSSDLAKLGGTLLGLNREETLDAYVAALLELVGPEGTIVVPTFTWGYASRGEPFIYEETPSDTGILSEHIRRRPDSLRSLHPLFSYTAIGAGKAAICAEVGRNSYGWETPSARMLEANAAGVSLGVHPREAASIIHCAEFLMGVPYRYHKRFSTPVYQAGQPIEGEFYAFLRYRAANIARSREPMLSRMAEKGLYKEVPIGRSAVYSYRVRGIFDEAVALIKEDVTALQNHDPRELPVID